MVGMYLAYGNTSVPSSYSSSPTLLGIDVLAFLVGVTVGFAVNERTTVRKIVAREETGIRAVLLRLAKYQGVYVVGNAMTIGIQFLLLASFALSPAAGVVIGAIAAYPVSYFISMRVVWKPRGTQI